MGHVRVGRGPRRPLTVSERRRALRDSLTASGDSPVDTTYDMTRGTLAERRYYELVLASGYSEVRCDAWPSETATLGDIPGVVFRDDETVVVKAKDGQLALVRLGNGWLHVSCAAPTIDAAVSVCSAFRQAYPATYLSNQPGNQVPITFWTNTKFGPTARLRRIESASWKDIEQNYTASVKTALTDLMSWKEPSGSGQLILWQGEPGTGKSWALRCLASEWSSFCEFHYITDPDSFFVQDPSYMINVLLSDSYETVTPTGDVYTETDKLGKWRLLILEDTGELLAANAKDSYGQGLSRLLNVVDGMIGQGLRVLALVTTNDELGDLHPAVARPGRCASQIEFAPLTAEEASVWLGHETTVGGTVAELYSRNLAGTDALPADALQVEEPELAASGYEHILAVANSPLRVTAR